MTVNIDKLKTAQDTAGRTSSKGNQNKWVENGIWYKEDGLGYEALAEVLVSRLLEKTNVGQFVHYQYESLERGGRLYHGCSSESFMLPEDDKVISVERLFQSFRGESAARAILRYGDQADRIRYIVENTEQITGLKNFGEYLRKILTVDALFLNEDRHFHNLAVIQRKDGTYRECPVFDNGAALFSDIKGDYPLEMKLDECFERIQAKPFSKDFDEQLDACEILYGSFVFRAAFTMEDVNAVLSEFAGIYEKRILKRVENLMRYQLRKYAYLF